MQGAIQVLGFTFSLLLGPAANLITYLSTDSLVQCFIHRRY